MNSTQQFIIAILAVLIPVLIPYIIKLIFEIKSQQLMNLEVLTDQYKETIKNLCLTAEALYKEGNGPAKMEFVIDKISNKINLPKEELRGFIESVLIETKKSLANEWNSLGKDKTP